MLGRGLESLIPPKQTSGASQLGLSSDDNFSSDNEEFLDDSKKDNQISEREEFHQEEKVQPERFQEKEESLESNVLKKEEGKSFEKTFVPAENVQDFNFKKDREESQEEKLKEKKEGFWQKELAEDTNLPISQPVFLIETEKIKANPYQPRRDFDQEKLQELVESIREFGILQPLVVSKSIIQKENGQEVEYQVVAGERRLMAAKILGLERVPVIIKEITEEREKLEMAIVENLQRKNLNPLEEARAFARLSDEFKMPQREIALRIGKSREAIANTLRLLQLSPEAQKKLEEGLITESHARIILTFSDHSKQNELLEKIIANQLSVRETQELAQNMARSLVGDVYFQTRRKRRSPTAKKEINPFLLEAARFLEEFLSTPVEVQPRGKSGGRIAIRFFDHDHLKEIIEKITKRE